MQEKGVPAKEINLIIFFTLKSMYIKINKSDINY